MRVIRDGCDVHTKRLEFFETFVQLHELSLTVWSPVCRAYKENEQPLLSLKIIEIQRIAVCILNGERRKRSPDRRRPVFRIFRIPINQGFQFLYTLIFASSRQQCDKDNRKQLSKSLQLSPRLT